MAISNLTTVGIFAVAMIRFYKYVKVPILAYN
ncbi:hypothetical protein COLO4_35367 [Corchorus olitorius]|uniref:Uncharacterized protein n=1 Tax=Corchorus olitorius TaxID=93759 RepID=A0A1R3GHA9_9ROSI|nr:hypothetical protein COLO4_35367 [Corchorus olitorius]